MKQATYLVLAGGRYGERALSDPTLPQTLLVVQAASSHNCQV